MNLVVGATGVLGSEICRQLAQKGMPVRAMVRPTSNTAGVEELSRLGVELVKGDLKQPSSVAEACRGADVAISTVTTTASRQPGDTIESVDDEGQRKLVDAARANGVRHFVYVSYSADIDRDDPCPLTVAKRNVERHLQQTGMTYTILRPSVFMDLWLSPILGFDYANAKAQVFGTGDNKISWIAARDVAQFAVAALTTPSARNTAWELGGPEALSPNEVIRLFEEIGGRPFDVTRMPVEALRAQRAAATDSLDQSLAALSLAIAAGNVIDMRPVLDVCPVQMMSVREYSEAVMAAQRV